MSSHVAMGISCEQVNPAQTETARKYGNDTRTALSPPLLAIIWGDQENTFKEETTIPNEQLCFMGKFIQFNDGECN